MNDRIKKLITDVSKKYVGKIAIVAIGSSYFRDMTIEVVKELEAKGMAKEEIEKALPLIGINLNVIIDDEADYDKYNDDEYIEQRLYDEVDGMVQADKDSLLVSLWMRYEKEKVINDFKKQDGVE